MRAPIATWFHWTDRTLILEVAVRPGAAQTQFAGLHGGALKIRVRGGPVDGKANSCLIEFLAHEFATPRSRISIVRGGMSRVKTLCISAPEMLPGDLTALGLSAAYQVVNATQQNPRGENYQRRP